MPIGEGSNQLNLGRAVFELRTDKEALKTDMEDAKRQVQDLARELARRNERLGRQISTSNKETSKSMAQSVKDVISEYNQLNTSTKQTSKLMGLSLREVMNEYNKIDGAISNAISSAVGFAGANYAMSLFNKTVNLFKNSIIGMNSQLENSTAQFEILFKNADRAETHVKELYEFARTTPFNVSSVIQASKTLQQFGGDTLNTIDNLKLIGDAASVAGRDITSVAFSIARAQSLIEGGQPFGRASRRLQEMGIVSTEALIKMRDLQEEGASANEVWSVMEGELRKLNGSMDRMSGTWSGVMGTFNTTIQAISAQVGESLFTNLRDSMDGLNQTLQSPAFSAGVDVVAKLAGELFGVLKSLPLLVAGLSAVGLALVGLKIRTFIVYFNGLAASTSRAAAAQTILARVMRRPLGAALAVTAALAGLDLIVRKLSGYGIISWFTGQAQEAERMKRIMESVVDTQDRINELTTMGASHEVARRIALQESADAAKELFNNQGNVLHQLADLQEQAEGLELQMDKWHEDLEAGLNPDRFDYLRISEELKGINDDILDLDAKDKIEEFNEALEKQFTNMRESGITSEVARVLLRHYIDTYPEAKRFVDDLAESERRAAEVQDELNKKFEKAIEIQNRLKDLQREGLDSSLLPTATVLEYAEAISTVTEEYETSKRKIVGVQAELDHLIETQGNSSIAYANSKKELDELNKVRDDAFDSQEELIEAVKEENFTHKQWQLLIKEAPHLQELFSDEIKKALDIHKNMENNLGRVNDMMDRHNILAKDGMSTEQLRVVKLHDYFNALDKATDGINDNAFEQEALKNLIDDLNPTYEELNELLRKQPQLYDEISGRLGIIKQGYRETALEILDATIIANEFARATMPDINRQYEQSLVDIYGMSVPELREWIEERRETTPGGGGGGGTTVPDYEAFTAENMEIFETYTARVNAVFEIEDPEQQKEAFNDVMGDLQGLIDEEEEKILEMRRLGVPDPDALEASQRNLEELRNIESTLTIRGRRNLLEATQELEGFSAASTEVIQGYGDRAQEIIDNIDPDNLRESLASAEEGIAEITTEIGRRMSEIEKDIQDIEFDGVTETEQTRLAELREEYNALQASANRVQLIQSLGMDEYLQKIEDMNEETKEFYDTLVEGANRAQNNMRQLHQDINSLGQIIITALRRQAQEELDITMNDIQRRQDALQSQHNERMAMLDEEQRKVREYYGFLLDVLDAQETEERTQGLQRQLALAVDPMERARVQEQIRQHERQQLRDAIIEEQRAVEQQIDNERSRLQDEFDYKRELLNAERDVARQTYQETTDAYALQLEARRLLEEGHQDELVSLLENYYPEWETAGYSFGEQLVDGLKRSGVTDFIADLHTDLRAVPSLLNAIDAPVDFSLLSPEEQDAIVSGEDVPTFAGGGTMPETGLAYLHKGETVRTPAQEAALGKGTTVKVYIGDDELRPHLVKVVDERIDDQIIDAHEYGHRTEETLV